MGAYSSLSVEELLQRCAQSGDVAAWEEFVRRFHRLIAKVILRTCIRFGDLSSETVDDLIQETYLKLSANDFRVLREFEHRHPNAFVGFLQVLAVNIAKDHFKSIRSPKHGADHVDPAPEGFVAPAAEGSAGSVKTMERNVLIAEISRCVDACVTGPDAERNRTIFWLRFRVGLSAASIASLPGINLTEKGVESLVSRILRDVRTRVGALNAARPSVLHKADEGILPLESF